MHISHLDESDRTGFTLVQCQTGCPLKNTSGRRLWTLWNLEIGSILWRETCVEVETIGCRASVVTRIQKLVDLKVQHIKRISVQKNACFVSGKV